MSNFDSSHSSPFLKILPAYTGLTTVEAVLHAPRARCLLWLEILLNEQFDMTQWEQDSEVQEAYVKACRWFTTYRSLIQSVLPRVSLPADSGTIDQREYRMFVEALQFVAHRS